MPLADDIEEFRRNVAKAIEELEEVRGVSDKLTECTVDEIHRHLTQLQDLCEQVSIEIKRATEQLIEINTKWGSESLKSYLGRQNKQDVIEKRDSNLITRWTDQSRLIREYSKEVIKHVGLGFEEGLSYSPQMMQGKAGEMVAVSTGAGCLLDNITDKLNSGTPGGHFFVYDTVGGNTVGSVKVRGIRYYGTSTRNSKSYFYAYMNDFYLAIGYKQDTKFEKAATCLLEAKEKQLIPISDEMQSVTDVETMKQYLYTHAVLYIPDNHVNELQEMLTQKIQECPEAFKQYGLNDDPTERDIQTYLQKRIKPIGIDSDFIAIKLYDELKARLILFLAQLTFQ